MKMWDVTIRIPLPDYVEPPKAQGRAVVFWPGSDSHEGVATAVRGVDQLQAEGITLPAFKVGP